MEESEKEMLERNTKSRLGSHPEPTAEAASLLTDDLILEILSRLPVRSLHRSKCVSVSWRRLISDPANRKKLPQALAGFLYMTVNRGRRHHFASVSGGGAAPFDTCLPHLHHNKYDSIIQVDACHGLLLYHRYTNKWTDEDFPFLVCNPTTGRWVELPPQPHAPADTYSRRAGLAFDPAVSSHFHVLRFEERLQGNCITGEVSVNIYSSRTGAWTRRYSGMAEKIRLDFSTRFVFVGGMLYRMANFADPSSDYVLLGVDMEGKVWKTITVPYSQRFDKRRAFATIGWSQGCLHYAIASLDDNKQISGIELWFLQDCNSKELVLKHKASFNKLMSMTGQNYNVVGIHLDCDTVFLVSHRPDTLVSYNMRHQKVVCIINLEKSNTQQFLPYVPLFSESLADADGH